MIPFLKPRSFWDYAVVALGITGLLFFLFWLNASDGVGRADAALAFAVAVLSVFVVVLVRRGEKAAWIARPTRFLNLLFVLGSFGLMFAATYADSFLLHRKDLTRGRLRDDTINFVVLSVALLWTTRKWPSETGPAS